MIQGFEEKGSLRPLENDFSVKFNNFGFLVENRNRSGNSTTLGSALFE